MSALKTPPALPLFLTRENKWAVGLVWFVIASFLYLTSNHFPIFTPQLLPMTPLDQAIPFLPHTVWIYISEYIFFFVIYALSKDLANANKYLYSFLGLQMISAAIFWVWPTTFPRELFPLPQDLDALTHLVFTQLRQTDSPNNCCPSLHVSSVYLASFVFLDEQRKRFPLFFIWGTLIALSTLTTKQHYIVDVVAGLGMAMLTWWIFNRVVIYRATASTAEVRT